MYLVVEIHTDIWFIIRRTSSKTAGMSVISSNRLSFIKTINQNTPACVIAEIAASMKFKVDLRLMSDRYVNVLFDAIRDEARSEGVIEIDSDDGTLKIDTNNLSNAARFINSDMLEWTLPELNLAFMHLVGIFTDTVLVDLALPVGRKTPNEPLALDACILYRECVRQNVRSDRWVTMDGMHKRLLYTQISKAELIEKLCAADHRAPVDTQTIRWCNSNMDIGETLEQMKKIPAIGIRTNPLTHEEAVVLGFRVLSFDLSYSSSPIDMYTSLRNNIRVTDAMIMEYGDSLMIALWNRDKRWMRGRSGSRILWNRSLLALYEDEEITEMENIEFNEGEEECMERLDLLCDTVHIYEGLHPDLPFACDRTLLLSHKLHEADQIYHTIGVVSDPSSLYIVTESEMCKLFRDRQCFCTPMSYRSIFSVHALHKLRSICSCELLATFEYVENSMDGVHNLADRIRVSRGAECIMQYIEGIMDLAYYMRGWKSADCEFTTLPLESENTQSMSDNFVRIEENYAAQSRKNADMFSAMSRESQLLIEEIPLMILMDDGSFAISCNDDVGRTLMDKLDIVNNGNNDNACIRLSSNYILHTCWYWADKCFGVKLFELDSLSFIS